MKAIVLLVFMTIPIMAGAEGRPDPTWPIDVVILSKMFKDSGITPQYIQRTDSFNAPIDAYIWKHYLKDTGVEPIIIIDDNRGPKGKHGDDLIRHRAPDTKQVFRQSPKTVTGR